ncbi:MAG: nucleotidyl transferase AbiEii/AbiGii toxin family protein [Bacteroidales bacterium]|nr:nucleotidyl transferase AbiEii/AbiGii toxin family protein [Bacteroidales bacterium]
MLLKETIDASTLELLKRLMSDERLDGFVLVGGTALSLQMGHRISVDLDLFVNNDYEAEALREYLERNYHLETDYLAFATVKGEIGGVQVDCIAHSYPWIRPFIEEDGIRLASMEDICAMILNAIAGNGTRIKDFVDVAYLSSLFSLRQMLSFYEEKYHANPLMPLKGIVYFDDVNKTAPVKMTNGKPLDWKIIEKRLLAMEKYPNKIFASL